MAGPVYVCFWFDTEDYVTPAADDAAQRLAEMFTRHHAKATFKVVTQKVMRFDDRDLSGFIGALARHDLGFHTSSHSRHPTVTEYCEPLGWDEGIAAFRERESYGLEHLRHVFRRPFSTYGQPGGAWAPHVFPVLREWGIPTYVDEGGHIGLNEQPFWYQGVLNVFGMGRNFTRMDLRRPEGLAEGQARFDAIYERLRSSGGGLISICFHPCEWVTEEFWDAVNFARGQNPAGRLRRPRRTPKREVERRFGVFEKYLEHILATGAQTIACADLPRLYPDETRTRYFSLEEVLEATKDWDTEIGPVRTDAGWLSAAELFAFVATHHSPHSRAWRSSVRGQPRWDPADEEQTYEPIGHIQGPSRRAAALTRPIELPLLSLMNAIPRELLASPYGPRMPSALLVDGHIVPPADWLSAAIRVLQHTRRRGRAPRSVELRPAKLVTEDCVADSGVWDWIIFPEGFTAPNCVELAKLQAWTLKPAVLAS